MRIWRRSLPADELGYALHWPMLLGKSPPTSSPDDKERTAAQHGIQDVGDHTIKFFPCNGYS